MNAITSQLNEKDNVNLQRVLNYDLLVKLLDRSPCSSSDYQQLKPDLYSWDKVTEKRKSDWVMFYIKLFAVTNDCTQFPPFNIRKFPNKYEIGLYPQLYASALLEMDSGSFIKGTSLVKGLSGESLTIESKVNGTGNIVFVTVEKDGSNTVIESGIRSMMVIQANFGSGVEEIKLYCNNNEDAYVNNIHQWTSDGKIDQESPVWYTLTRTNTKKSLIKYTDIDVVAGEFKLDPSDNNWPDEVSWAGATKRGGATDTPVITALNADIKYALLIASEKPGLDVVFSLEPSSDEDALLASDGPVQLSL
jgi:hypothetical protein